MKIVTVNVQESKAHLYSSQVFLWPADTKEVLIC
jgi:hypothetical protein